MTLQKTNRLSIIESSYRTNNLCRNQYSYVGITRQPSPLIIQFLTGIGNRDIGILMFAGCKIVLRKIRSSSGYMRGVLDVYSSSWRGWGNWNGETEFPRGWIENIASFSGMKCIKKFLAMFITIFDCVWQGCIHFFQSGCNR